MMNLEVPSAVTLKGRNTPRGRRAQPPPQQKLQGSDRTQDQQSKTRPSHPVRKQRAAETRAAETGAFQRTATQKRAAETRAGETRTAELRTAETGAFQRTATQRRAAQTGAAEKRRATQRTAAQKRAAQTGAAQTGAAQKRAAEKNKAQKRAAEKRTAAQKRAAEKRTAAQTGAAQTGAAQKRATKKNKAQKRAAEKRAAQRRAQQLPEQQQQLVKAQEKVVRRKQAKAKRRLKAERNGKIGAKGRRVKAKIQEVHQGLNNIKSDRFDMNRGFTPMPQNHFLRPDNRGLMLRPAQPDQHCLQGNTASPFSPSQRMPPHVWSPHPAYTRPGPTKEHMANGRSRKRSRDDQGSFDPKRQRLSSPPQPCPGASSLSSPQTLSSLWGANSTLHPLSTDKLSCQILEVFEACGQKTSDLERKELCRTQLQKEIQRLFPLARLFLAGSSLNGFGSSSSDADLCMVLPRVSGEWNEAVSVLGQINKLFRKLAYLRNIQLIKAKVPILKAKDTVSGVEFDLNINNTVGIRNTFLLRSYAYAEPRVRPIIMVVKRWAQYCLINDASQGTLSSYTLVLMVLHYLQTLNNPVVPSLQQQFPECFSVSMDIHMVPEGPRHIPAFSSTNTLSLGELLLGFLKYYTCTFRWDQKVISIREAKAIPRTSSSEWKNKFICVEEPFEQRNTARAVYEKSKFDTIKRCFTESWRALQESKDLNSILPVRLMITGR